MKQRIKRYARRVLNLLPSSPNPALEARVLRLEQELDEYRRDSLRVAEMLDLLEYRLSPSSRKKGH
ncbi:DUF6752 domain-containing protein [Leucobacter denitrificans]|uniref:DUF6752 domain-containing protein n=1 Tax=Leucobacter denitrificans TaxID=683042 RepID=UPI0036174D8C